MDNMDNSNLMMVMMVIGDKDIVIVMLNKMITITLTLIIRGINKSNMLLTAIVSIGLIIMMMVIIMMVIIMMVMVVCWQVMALVRYLMIN